MPRLMRAALLAVVAIVAAGGATALDLPPMPLYTSMPPGCGLLAQVTPDMPNCAAMA